ncbi:MAG: hypothetical protein KKF16_08910 [Euryarchaeota archaeon]|nr:hypothetical protein [Euryarchaeota archaeon]MBU4606988.1 hypothetical protein [Euryarchaeota archaeon]MBV1729792.1 hypothetical protein [Methanobacterium sp.]MBV1754856.1 hypothetical protein [Methanobacterium sp.]
MILIKRFSRKKYSKRTPEKLGIKDLTDMDLAIVDTLKKHEEDLDYKYFIEDLARKTVSAYVDYDEKPVIERIGQLYTIGVFIAWPSEENPKKIIPNPKIVKENL